MSDPDVGKLRNISRSWPVLPDSLITLYRALQADGSLVDDACASLFLLVTNAYPRRLAIPLGH